MADPPADSATKVWAIEPHPKDPDPHVVKTLCWRHDRGDVYSLRTWRRSHVRKIKLLRHVGL